MKIKHKWIILSFLFCLLVLPNFASAAKSDISIETKYLEANLNFTLKLFSESIKKSEGKNLLLSPSGIAIVLSMAYEGAAGQTRQGIADALLLKALQPEEIERGAFDLSESLFENKKHGLELQIANSVWFDKSIKLKRSFKKRTQKNYKATREKTSFRKPKTLSKINSWVSKQTHGRIHEIIHSISPEDRILLVNAIYFKGFWSKSFDKTKTGDEVFIGIDRNQKKVPMMSGTGSYEYLKEDKFQAINLPYSDAKMSLYVFLPNETLSLNEFLKDLTSENWNKWIDEFLEREGEIRLPRFEVSYENDMKDILKALGAGGAFDLLQANFEAMIAKSDKPVFISAFKQKTWLKVDEDGSEAAAVTSAVLGLTSAFEKFQMVVNRPFFYALRDNKTGVLLFLGVINQI